MPKRVEVGVVTRDKGSKTRRVEIPRLVRHPIYGTFAAKDQGIPPAEVAQFVTTMRNIGITHDVHIYDDVDHGFWLWVDQEPEVRAAPALDAWERLVEYLDETLDE